MVAWGLLGASLAIRNSSLFLRTLSNLASLGYSMLSCEACSKDPKKPDGAAATDGKGGKGKGKGKKGKAVSKKKAKSAIALSNHRLVGSVKCWAGQAGA